MSIAGLKRHDVTSFSGPVVPPQVEASDIPPDASLWAENVRFLPGKVESREGHTVLFDPNAAVTAGYNWLTTDLNRLVYFKDGTTLVVRNLASGVEDVIGTHAAYSVLPQQIGDRLYVVLQQAPGGSASEVRVWDGLFTADVPNYFKIAPAPLSTVPVVTEVGTGDVTKGDHRITYIAESKTGFIGKPCATYATVTAAGGKTLNVSINTTFPTWVSRIWVLMTTASNLERFYFVPGGGVSVPTGTPWNLQITVDCSDDRLELDNDDATDYFNWLTQDASGNGPFTAVAATCYSKRLVVSAGDKVYVSEPNNYEAFTEDQHVIRIPGEKPTKALSTQGSTLYLYGPNYTYSTADNSDVPATWGQPIEVSGSIGADHANCVADNSDHGYSWVASRGGLYRFDGGKYPELPASYYQSPIWNRINWVYAHTVRIVEHTTTQRVYVVAPLDAATSPTHILVFDYSMGATPSKIRFSLDSISGVSPGFISRILNPSSNTDDIIIGCSSAGPIYRRRSPKETEDASTRTDNGAAIVCDFKTAPLPPGPGITRRLQVRAVDLRLQGGGTLAPSAVSLDGTKTKSLLPISLSATPDVVYRRKFHLLAPKASIRIQSNSASTWWALSGLTAWYSQFSD